MKRLHFPDAICDRETCGLCGAPATHRLSEQVSVHDYWWLNSTRIVFLCCHCISKARGESEACESSLDLESPGVSLTDFELEPVHDQEVAFGEWTLKHEERTLKHRFYEIPIDECLNSEELVDWLAQLKEKTWVTSDTIADFLTAIDEIRGLRDHRDLKAGFQLNPYKRSVRHQG